MKRFFLLSAIAIVLTVLLCIFSNSVIYFSAFLFPILIISSFLIKKYKKKFLNSIIAFILISLISFFYTNHYLSLCNSLNELIGTTNTFNCTIVEEPKNVGNYYTYIVEPDKGVFEGANFNFKIKLNCSFNIGAEAYDKLRVCAELKGLNREGKLSNYSNNIMLSGKLKYCSFKVVDKKPIYYVIKKRIVSAFKCAGDGDLTGIPIAILTGDKSYLSNEFYSNIKTTGMAHVMAVSGFHISVICMNIVLLMHKLKFGKKNAAILGLILLFLLMGVAGFTGSVLRSGLMYIIIFLGELISRRPDALNSLGFAITVLCFINPYSVFNVSLQLSAFGTLGILLLTPTLTDALIERVRLRGKPKIIFNYFAQILIVSFSAGLFVMPISLVTFGYVSVISVLVNLFITIPVYVNIFSSILYVLLYKVPFLSQLIIYISKGSSWIFKYIIDFFADFNLAVFRVDDILVFVILAISILFCLSVIVFKRNTINVYVSLLISIILFMTSLVIQDNINEKTVRITYFPTSTGHLVVVESRGESVLISSTTDSYALNDVYYYFNENLNDTIDYLLIASNDSNVLENTISLTEKLDVNEIRLCNNTIGFEINGAEFVISGEGDLYNVLIYLTNETITIDNTGTSAYKTDYILTRNPLLSYKLNGAHSSYIIDGGLRKSVNMSGYLSSKGAKTAILSEYGRITSKKIGYNLLKFKR